MATLTVSNLPEEVHRALRTRAAQHGRSTEAEACAILSHAVKPGERHQMGEALVALGRDVGLTNEDIEAIELARNKTPAQPLSLE